MKEKHIGVSKLREYNSDKLQEFANGEELLIIHDHAEPIAVMFPFDVYISLQDRYKQLKQILEIRERTDG